MRTFAFLIPAVLACTVSQGQVFTAEANLPSVDADGFYRIDLGIQAGAYLEHPYAFRIFDADCTEVSYLLEKEPSYVLDEVFIAYPMLEKKQIKGCCTTLLLGNPDGKPINNLVLVIGNAEVDKQATLTGSDDQQTWYALKEHVRLTNINNNDSSAESRPIHFPLTNYRYLTLTINDSVSSPLNILGAGHYSTMKTQGSYEEVAFVRTIVSDSAKQKATYIHLHLDAERALDKISLKMGGAPYFQRQARLLVPDTVMMNRKKTLLYRPLISFQIHSQDSLEIHPPDVRSQDYVIEVFNDDNPSLTLVAAKGWQLNAYAIAWLQKGKWYSVRFGKGLRIPSYDLYNFRSSIPEKIPALQIKNIKPIVEETQGDSSPTFFTSRRMIWVAIIVVIVLLGFITLRMVRER